MAAGKGAAKKPSHFPNTPYLHSSPSPERQVVVDIAADYVHSVSPASSHSHSKRTSHSHAFPSRPAPSRASSNTSLTAPPSPPYPPSILSEDSAPPALHPYARSTGGMRSSSSKRPGTGHSAKGAAPPGILEEMEEADELRGLRSESKDVLGGLDRYNQSTASVASRHKADKMLGLDPNAKLASLYLVSGLGKSTAQWSLADTDATRGVQPLEDSLGLFWRPDMLGSSFSGDKLGAPTSTPADDSGKGRTRKDSKASTYSNGGGLSKDLRGKYVPDAGPLGPQRLVAKTLKFAHARDVEVVNSTLAPPTTCHAFTFTTPRHDTLAAVARTRLASAASDLPGSSPLAPGSTSTPAPRGGPAYPAATTRGMANATEITFYGVTLTVWTHADRERAIQLKGIKLRANRLKLGTQNSTGSMNPASPQPHGAHRKASTTSDRKGRSRRSLGYMLRNQSEGDVTVGSETETGMSDSDMEVGGGGGRRGMRGWAERLSVVESVPEDARAAYDEQSDIFWMPYAITMVSRYPIYDTLQDYLRLSWARFSKNARLHMTQVSRILNTLPPRPGELFRLPVGQGVDDEVVVEGCMPGGLMDFDKGLVKVDFQMWPLFAALDLDHIITCAEVALSNSGRIIFCSKHPAMLNIAVSTLRYLVELRGWDGIALPMIHARDTTFIIEDPGPYIIGMSTECRYLLVPPAEVVVVDLDTNSLACKSPPPHVITPRPRREKAKQKLLSALGPSFPTDRSIPMEFKVSYPKGNFRNFNRFSYRGERPAFLGERLRAPGWWGFEAVVGVFDKILADKHKKPSLIQRLTKTGMARAQAQLTVGEQLAKSMMRRRALHYVETRDDLEIKVAKINRRLLKLIQEGEHWKNQFETFEKYADRLTVEANELKSKIDRERREAKRLSSLATEQSKQNVELEEKLRNTESARAEAMRQLSDMHHSIQELEREREEIMNSIEMQIAGALDTYGPVPSSPSTITSRPGTPGTNGAGGASVYDVLSVGSRRGRRPITADSQRSVMSGMSGLTGVSVLGQVRGEGRRRGAGAGGAGAVAGAGGKGDAASVVTERTYQGTAGGDGSIAQRVASIHAKLEMALSVVSSQRSSSSLGPTDGEDTSGGEGEGESDAYADADDPEDAIESGGEPTGTTPSTASSISAGSADTAPTSASSGLGLTMTDDASRTEESGDESEAETERWVRTPTASRRPSMASAKCGAPGEAQREEEVPPVPVKSAAAAGAGVVPLTDAKSKVRPKAGSKAGSVRSVSTDKAAPQPHSQLKSKAAPAPTPAVTEITVIPPQAKANGKGKGKGKAQPRTITQPTAEGILLAHPGSTASASDSGSEGSYETAGGGGGEGKLPVREEDEPEVEILGVGNRMSTMSTTTITLGKAV
ncbi:hypothetical protein IAT38_002014 [Cryptococcus sp. DSM 104549]